MNYTTTVNNVILAIDGKKYAVKEFVCDFAVGYGSRMSCELLTGIPINGKKGTSNGFSNASTLLSVGYGKIGELYIECASDSIGGASYLLFKGFLVSTSFDATAGGVTSDASFTVSAQFSHIGAGLGSFNIGNRVFTPHGQSREPFIPSNKFINLGQDSSCETDGADKLDVAAHVVELVEKYKQWLGGATDNDPVLTYTPAILNTANLGGAASSVLKQYILQVTTTVLNNVQQGGTVLQLLDALCREFFLQITPTYDGLHISHQMPCYKADNNSLKFTNSGISSVGNTVIRELMPPTAVWVPRTFTPNFIKLTPSQKLIHNPLYTQIIQDNNKYFKYPEYDKGSKPNSVIVEPPMFLKHILNNILDKTESSNTSTKKQASTTSAKAASKSTEKTKEDPKQALLIGQSIAKLLYCDIAYSPCSLTLTQPGTYTLLRGYGIYDMVGSVCECMVTLKGARIIHSVVGYVHNIVLSFDRDSQSFTCKLGLSHLRLKSVDAMHSLSKDDQLLYKK